MDVKAADYPTAAPDRIWRILCEQDDHSCSGPRFILGERRAYSRRRLHNYGDYYRTDVVRMDPKLGPIFSTVTLPDLTGTLTAPGTQEP
jgi:hypothetical protein